MAHFIDDDFESYSIGQNPPYNTGLSGTLVQEAGNNVIAAGGPNGSTKMMQQNPGFGGVTFDRGTSGTAATFTTWCSWQHQEGPFGPLGGGHIQYLAYVNPNAGARLTLAQLTVNQDSTIMFQTGTGTDTSIIVTPVAFDSRRWYYLQHAVHFLPAVDGTTVLCEATLIANGTVLFTSSQFPTGHVIGPNANQLSGNVIGTDALVCTGMTFFPTNAFTEWDNITIDGGYTNFPTFPHQGAVVDARITQVPIEILELPDRGAVRVSQTPLEILELPNSANIRVTQGVIELVVGEGSDWQVYEA